MTMEEQRVVFTKIWRALKKKFHVGGQVTQTTRYTELIAMMAFWWIWDAGGLRLHPELQRKFMIFLEIFDGGEEEE